MAVNRLDCTQVYKGGVLINYKCPIIDDRVPVIKCISLLRKLSGFFCSIFHGAIDQDVIA